VTVHRGDVRRTVLFDTGPEGLRLRAQCDAASASISARSKASCSRTAMRITLAPCCSRLGMIRGRNGGRDVPFYAQSGMFMTRGVRQPNGKVRQMEDVPSLADLAISVRPWW